MHALDTPHLGHVVPFGSGKALCTVTRNEVALGRRVCAEDLDPAPRLELRLVRILARSAGGGGTG